MKIYTTAKQDFHTKVLSEQAFALTATDYKDPPTIITGSENSMNYTVRRLMPIEEERLQGFPDNWTDLGEWTDSQGKKHKDADSPRYRALGNSICLPFWFQLLRRIAAQYERPATLGSLFDGISGFPLVWARCNGGAKYCLWSSEIDEFCKAVARKHFGDEETGERGDVNELL